MKCALDLDGIITEWSRPLWIPIWFLEVVFSLFPWVLFFSKERKEMAVFIKQLARNNAEIIIVSARPDSCHRITERWLRKKGIPFGKVFCIGMRTSKNVILQEERVCFFVDDEIERVQEAIKGNIDALHLSEVL